MAKQIDPPDALRNFDQLPDSAFVRLPTVCGLFDCSPNTVWRMSKDHRLPAPVKLGPRITGWNVGAVRKTLESGFGEFEPVVIKKPAASDDGKRSK